MCHVNRWPWTQTQWLCLGQPPHEFSRHILPQTVILSGSSRREAVNLPQTLGSGHTFLNQPIESISSPVEWCLPYLNADRLRCQAEHWVNFQARYVTDLQLSVNQPPTQFNYSSSTLCSVRFKTTHHNRKKNTTCPIQVCFLINPVMHQLFVSRTYCLSPPY